MNPELEALVLAFDNVLQARIGEEAKQRDALYQSRLDEVLARCPNLSRDTLLRAVDFAHWKWLAAQKKVSFSPAESLTPRACRDRASFSFQRLIRQTRMLLFPSFALG